MYLALSSFFVSFPFPSFPSLFCHLSLPLFRLFSSPPPHHIPPPPHHIPLQPTLILHIVSRPHTKGPLSLPFSLFPFVCGVGVVRSMSMDCEWMCCGAGCGVVRVPFPLFSFFLFLNFPISPFL